MRSSTLVLTQDVHFALRWLLKNRAFAIAVLISLSIGIGANTAMFSVADGVLLRPLPYKNADRLAILWNRSPGLNITQDWFSTAQYFDIKSAKSFSDVAIAIGGNENFTGSAQPERIGVVHTSSNLLQMLGTHPALGRLLLPAEDHEGGPLTALLSDALWTRRFARDPAVVGKSLTLNGKVYQVVGVLPKSFTLPYEVFPTLGGAALAEAVLSLPLAASASTVRGHEDYNVLARFASGVTFKQAQAEMDALTARLRHDFPANYPPNGGLTFGVVPLQEQVAGDVRRSLFVLLASVALVLLIACANVANLLLSRSAARHKEIAVRLALGASAARVVRQLVTESLVLALAGGLLGIALAWVGVRSVHILGPGIVPRLPDISINARVLLYALAISVFAGIVFGLAPALRVRGLDVNSALKSAGRGSGGALWSRGNSLRKLLVLSEFTLCVMLLVGAGLLIRSFVRLEAVAPGFDPHGVLTFELTMTGQRYSSRDAIVESYRRLTEKLEQIPGVTHAGAITALPFSSLWAWGPIVVEGRIPAPGEQFINADERVVTGDYFQAMRIPLIAGRFFTDQDNSANPRAAVIDEFMARQLWPGQDAIGRRFKSVDSPNASWITVVGIAGRVKQYTLDVDSRIALYLPQRQFPSRAMFVVVRGSTAGPALAAAVSQAVASVDPDLPVFHVRTMEDRISDSLARRRFSMILLGSFAAFALVLAVIGIYGVVSYVVSQGTRELGIRIALGADYTAILSLVIRQGMWIALAGIAAGLVGGIAIAAAMRSLLFGVTAFDPLTYVAVCAILALVSLIASYIPARRATQVDPTISLRTD